MAPKEGIVKEVLGLGLVLSVLLTAPGMAAENAASPFHAVSQVSRLPTSMTDLELAEVQGQGLDICSYCANSAIVFQGNYNYQYQYEIGGNPGGVVVQVAVANQLNQTHINQRITGLCSNCSNSAIVVQGNQNYQYQYGEGRIVIQIQVANQRNHAVIQQEINDQGSPVSCSYCSNSAVLIQSNLSVQYQEGIGLHVIQVQRTNQSNLGILYQMIR